MVVDVEEILQVRKLIGLAQGLNRRIGQRNAIAARQRKHQLGLEAALDVNVHLAFGQTRDQGVKHQLSDICRAGMVTAAHVRFVPLPD